MSKQLTILFHPEPAFGHVNPCIGLAEALRSRGHKIVFAIDQTFNGQLAKYGFEEELLSSPLKLNRDSLEPGQDSATIMLDSGMLTPISPLDKMKCFFKPSNILKFLDRSAAIELEFKPILYKHKPDIIVIDQVFPPWPLINSGKPWINFWSCNPLVIENEFTPPIGSGYPTNSDRNGWIEFKQLYQQSIASDESNQYTEQGVRNKQGYVVSPFLNLYNYPAELDYTDIRPVPDKWFGVNTFVRKGEEPFELPVQLKAWNGKLIYFSLGSFCSIDTELMKRLVNILSKTKHMFIVSKGLSGDKYELAANMWGKRSIPQTKVLPLVDLVITHGGNNTVTEAFTFGKPMIVLPLVFDQYDNAQRVHEKGFGVRLDPYLCSEEELLNSIEKLLNDNDLKERLALASKRIQSSNTLSRAVDMIEALVWSSY